MAPTSTSAHDFTAARRAMIDSQLRTSGVNEPFVLDRMSAVAREDFVPKDARGTAYVDRAIRLGEGSFLASPLFHGMMLAEARPQADDTVLIVDGGSGYLAELIRPLVASLEVISASDGAAGKAKSKGVSLLLVDGAAQELPEKLTKRLGENGRVVTGLVSGAVTRLAAGRAIGGKVSLVALAEIGVPHLAAFDKAPGWSF
jgi:protein-L-isoaspartate(D-aspartate) O-methyltransferase